MMEVFSLLSSMATARLRCLLDTFNMVSVTEKLNSTEYYLNVYIYIYFLPTLGLRVGMWDLVP